MRTWVEGSLKYWFEAASDGPGTNNGLESLNRQIKQAYTLRSKLAFHKFVECAESVLRSWSKDAKEPPVRPTVKSHLFVDAYHLQSGPEKRLVARVAGKFVYAASDSGFTTLAEVRDAYRAFVIPPVDWAGYVSTRFKVHVVSKPPGKELFVCTCIKGSRKHICKHALHAMCSPDIALFTYPAEALAAPLGMKRKRGRPRKAGAQNRYAIQ